jgi:hypothetical protein
MVWERFLKIIELCLHVIEIPDDSKIIVLSNGILIGLNVMILFGGHCAPISIVGDNLLWKNAQKKEEKNKISDKINNNIPHFIPIETFFVWIPWNVDSRTTSRHHWIIVNKIIIIPSTISFISLKWNHNTVPDVIDIIPIDPNKGQGL